MLWEGIRLYSRSQYEKIKPELRFILTEDVRNYLHSDIPENYLDRSILLVPIDTGYEIEVEGQNFLVVDDDIPDFTVIRLRDAERRYPEDATECRLTGSSVIAKLFQEDQDELLEKAGMPRHKVGLFGLKKKTKN